MTVEMKPLPNDLIDALLADYKKPEEWQPLHFGSSRNLFIPLRVVLKTGAAPSSDSGLRTPLGVFPNLTLLPKVTSSLRESLFYPQALRNEMVSFLSTGEAHMQRRFTLKALTAAVALSGLTAMPAFAADTIKVGILHSLSGTMAISETVLKDTVLMAIDEINA
ncbi:MAG: transporter substrate-binding protein, partial [Rhodoferax sp.]|nr:transporter substrate-binding protein [Rhodoferax sp.]